MGSERLIHLPEVKQQVSDRATGPPGWAVFFGGAASREVCEDSPV